MSPVQTVGYLVGVGRFELPTPSSRTKCATRLRHTPKSITTRVSSVYPYRPLPLMSRDSYQDASSNQPSNVTTIPPVNKLNKYPGELGRRQRKGPNELNEANYWPPGTHKAMFNKLPPCGKASGLFPPPKGSGGKQLTRL